MRLIALLVVAGFTWSQTFQSELLYMSKLNKNSPHKQLTRSKEAHSEWNCIQFQRGTVFLFMLSAHAVLTLMHSDIYSCLQTCRLSTKTRPLHWSTTQNALCDKEETNWTSRAARSDSRPGKTPLLGETYSRSRLQFVLIVRTAHTQCTLTWIRYALLSLYLVYVEQRKYKCCSENMIMIIH